MKVLNNKENLTIVLNLLEKEAEPLYRKALKENMNREQMLMTAEKCLELEKTINALLEQVDKLGEEKDQHSAKLLAAVDKIKGKSIKIGNILMMVHETIQKNPRKVTPQYKAILNGILEVYDINKGFVTRLFKKYQTITKGSTHVSKELEIQREANIKKLTKFIEAKTGKKVELREGIIQWIKEKGEGLVSFFIAWYNAIAKKSDKIISDASAAGITSDVTIEESPSTDIKRLEAGRNQVMESRPDEVEIETGGRHKIMEMRPDEIELETGGRHKIIDADEHLEEEKYPWNDCIEDQKKKYGKEGAKKVCGSIKAHNESVRSVIKVLLKQVK